MTEKISINLLPVEFQAEQAKKGRFYKIQAAGFSIILLMIFLSVLVFSLRIFQSNQIRQTETKAQEAETRVVSYASKEAQLVLLKNRLGAINQYLGTSSKQVEMFTLVNSLLPPSLQISGVSVGDGGTILISAITADTRSLDKIFVDLLDKEKNEGRIDKVAIENLNRSRDGIYRITFKVEAKK